MARVPTPRTRKKRAAAPGAPRKDAAKTTGASPKNAEKGCGHTIGGLLLGPQHAVTLRPEAARRVAQGKPRAEALKAARNATASVGVLRHGSEQWCPARFPR